MSNFFKVESFFFNRFFYRLNIIKIVLTFIRTLYFIRVYDNYYLSSMFYTTVYCKSRFSVIILQLINVYYIILYSACITMRKKMSQTRIGLDGRPLKIKVKRMQ